MRLIFLDGIVHHKNCPAKLMLRICYYKLLLIKYMQCYTQ